MRRSTEENIPGRKHQGVGLLLGALHEPVCPDRGWRGPGLCSPSVHSFSSQECLQRVVTGRKKMKRVQHTCVCVCSRWERADKCALAAHPNNVIICIFIQIIACYIMILYTVEYLT